MFGKIVSKELVMRSGSVEIGVLFRIVDHHNSHFKDLILVRTYSNLFVCIVGNDEYPSFHSSWGVHNEWQIEVLTNEQIILSNQEIK